MSEHYDKTTAVHYAAYRPPLHKLILGRVLDTEESFEFGLDVGCGTGQSAIALTHYCRQVVGIEPSEPMLERATQATGVKYIHGSAESIPALDQSPDVVTLAGSLYYADISKLVGELERVCRPNPIIIAYDFYISLETVLDELGIASADASGNHYDPTINFSGRTEFREILVSRERIDLQLTSAELTHLVLASGCGFEAVSNKYGTPYPDNTLLRKLAAHSIEAPSVKAEIFYSKYSLIS